jgi:hypothetical protein
MTREELVLKNLELQQEIDKISKEIRILEKYRQDAVRELYPICQHSKSNEAEHELDNGYGKWSKHKYLICAYCGAQKHWTYWIQSNYYFLNDLNEHFSSFKDFKIK